MCVVATKFIDGYGWIGAKNRDRNYKTEVHINQSNRYGVQRLYIDDQLSRWTEGVNEYGLCILSAAFSVKSDEKEADKITDQRKSKRNQEGYYSPDGRKIRKALLQKEPLKALKFLQKEKLAGATYAFNKKECYLLEGGYNVRKEDATKENPREYISKIVKIDKSEGYSVRTNHGILLPQLGYKKNPTDPKMKLSRKSSEMRLKYTEDELKKKMEHPNEVMDALSVSPNNDTFFNPIRLGNIKKGELATTGQILLIPDENSLHYRPILSTVRFEYDRINGPESKTFFEIVSSRKLLSFREWVSHK